MSTEHMSVLSLRMRPHRLYIYYSICWYLLSVFWEPKLNYREVMFWDMLESTEWSIEHFDKVMQKRHVAVSF